MSSKTVDNYLERIIIAHNKRKPIILPKLRRVSFFVKNNKKERIAVVKVLYKASIIRGITKIIDKKTVVALGRRAKAIINKNIPIPVHYH